MFDVRWYFSDSLHVLPGTTEGYVFCATLASRGRGKSFIMDVLSRLHDMRNADGSLVLGEELNNRLVPVCISFNAPQSLTADTYESPEVKLFSRLAHRAFFDGSLDSWPEFSRITRDKWTSVWPTVLFRAMLLYFERIGVQKPIILVALDEVIACGQAHALRCCGF
jgi:hypothetical protein